ncbi:Spc98 family-domain-containing protein [Syncephalastrum racemosum]|uniref:Spindle pole body component n=1 Tax=Syncephalastrum racemosum TaxID=13706 RepID=A0A1X2HCX2_SYNRA|nr:Spc98 family-domain-containing protein [Syncephalastrum racemosum]
MKSSHLRLLLSLHSSSSNTSANTTTTTTTTPAATGTTTASTITLPKSASSVFSYTHRLQSVVNQIRRSTAHWLFSNVLVGEHSLIRYLDSFRHMFLLGYGDLASNFIDASDLWRRRTLQNDTNKNKKRVSSSGSEEHRNEMIFRHQEFNALLAKASVGTDAEDRLEGYSVRLATSKQSPFDDLLLVDGYCTLKYDMRWPIDLFLGQAELGRYSELWSFLIGLKNVQTTLSKLWRVLRESSEKDKDERMLWRLRAQMLYWVGSLWGHVQANVIRTHYQRLLATMTSPEHRQDHDFEELQEAHGEYLDSVMRGCLLLSRSCSETMHQTLRTCLAFCELVERAAEDDGGWLRSKRRRTASGDKTAAEIVQAWTEDRAAEPGLYAWRDQVSRLEESFVASTSRFFGLVSNQPQHVKVDGHLDLLLMQLDYNEWYSAHRVRPVS